MNLFLKLNLKNFRFKYQLFTQKYNQATDLIRQMTTPNQQLKEYLVCFMSEFVVLRKYSPNLTNLQVAILS
jgi:hypothetical protein